MFQSFTSRLSIAEPGFASEKIRFFLHGQKSTHVSTKVGKGANSKCLIHRLSPDVSHSSDVWSNVLVSSRYLGVGMDRLD